MRGKIFLILACILAFLFVMVGNPSAAPAAPRREKRAAQPEWNLV